MTVDGRCIPLPLASDFSLFVTSFCSLSSFSLTETKHHISCKERKVEVFPIIVQCELTLKHFNHILRLHLSIKNKY